MAQLRIAVLECDTPIPSVVAGRGTYGDLFKALLTEGAARAGQHQRQLSLQFSTHDVVTAQKYPSLDEIDVVLLSGSSKYHRTRRVTIACR